MKMSEEVRPITATDWSEKVFLPPHLFMANSCSNQEIGYNDIFYAQSKIYGTNWSEFFPYFFEMMLVDSDGKPQSLNPVHAFYLPISPSELQIRTPFAIQVSATLKGIVEEHNAAPFQEISFSGTTGILPGDVRPTFPKLTNPSRFAQSLFGGTFRAAGNLISNVTQLLGMSDSAPQGETSRNNLRATGYFQFHLLISYML